MLATNKMLARVRVWYMGWCSREVYRPQALEPAAVADRTNPVDTPTEQINEISIQVTA